MGIYGYSWEPIKVVTDDGYTLSMMHVTGKNVVNDNGTITSVPGSNTNGPLLVQSALGTPPDRWLTYYFGENPTQNALFLRMYDDGFDIFFSFSRGTPASRVHD